jgi:hypothetical protein
VRGALSLGFPPIALVNDAIDGALIAAVLAAIGFVAKEIVASVREWRREDAERRVLLYRLQALLEATKAGYSVQNELRNRLYTQMTARFPDDAAGHVGYERLFTHVYDRMSPEERDLHRLIRAYTEHVLQPLNAATREWLEADAEYRLSRGKTGAEATLCRQLNTLDAHLLLWLAKYKMWIPDRPEHALVYLADEEDHGVPFPTGIEATLTEVLARHS